MANAVILKNPKTNEQIFPITDKTLVQGLSEQLNEKQERLISGTNIKTINNQSILGSGNITINSGNGTVTSYNDLSDKPNIPDENTISGWGFTKNQGTVTGIRLNGTNVTINNGVADLGNISTSTYNQVQSDWNEIDVSAASFIKNKPSIGDEFVNNKVTSLSNNSTDIQYPSAKCVYDALDGKQDVIDASHKIDYSLIDNVPTIPSVSGCEVTSNKVTAINAQSTDDQYPTAKCMYDKISSIENTLSSLETLLASI